MGFFDVINSLFGSLRDFASNSTEFNCSQCIKCRQCVKTLSDGKPVRIFTCTGVDDGLCDDEYIDSVLPSLENGLSEEYLEAYNKNREAVYEYIYNTGVLYTESSTPIYNEQWLPITSFNQLQYCYRAMECPKFRAFIDSNNILNTNDMLLNSPAPDIIDFNSLSKEDKIIVTQRHDW